MNPLPSHNSNLSHGLVMEFTVYDEDRENLSSAAFEWLTDGVGVAAKRGELEALPTGLRVSEAGFSRVREVLSRTSRKGLWGYFLVSPQNTFDVLYNPYVEAVLPWLKSHLRSFPESAEVKIGEFAADGEIGNASIRLSVSFDEELECYAKLTFHVDEAVLVDRSLTQEAHADLLAVVNWACRRFNVVFGHFSYAHSGGATDLERHMRGPARVPARNTPLWRSRLRGYSWLMVVSSDVARILGGPDAVYASGAFNRVALLPNGSLLLQATPLFQEYRGKPVAAVHRVVRDALVEGELRGLSPAPGQPPSHTVILD